MTPVFQTDFRAPGGNCFQACVASIMDLHLDEVPHFLKDSDGGNWRQERWEAVREFAREHNLAACWLSPGEEEDSKYIPDLFRSGLYYIATGPIAGSQYGHCVVGLGGKFVHDPSTSDGCIFSGEPWLYIFFPRIEDCKMVEISDVLLRA